MTCAPVKARTATEPAPTPPPRTREKLRGSAYYRKVTGLPTTRMAEFTNFLYIYCRVGLGWPDGGICRRYEMKA